MPADRQPASYDADRPHVFVCYSHNDRRAVFTELIALQETGLNFWFDERMHPGSEWPAELAAAISTCEGLLYFISPSSVATQNCRNEVQYARDHGKPIVAVYLEDTALPPALALTLATTHALKRYALDRDAYRGQLIAALKDSSFQHPPTVRRTIWTPRLRERALWAVAVVVVAAVAALAFRSQTAAPTGVQARFSVGVPDGLDITPASYFEMFVPPPLAVSPDGTQLVFSARDGTGSPALYRRGLNAFESQPIAGSEGGTSPFFSPDGRWVAFVVDRALKKIPLAGGQAETIVPDMPGSGFGGGSWSRNGTIVYSPGAVSGLFAVPAGGGESVRVSEPDAAVGELSHAMPQILPSGDTVLLSVRMGMAPEAPVVQVMSLETGERRALVPEAIGARYARGRLIYGGSGASTGSLWAAPFDEDRQVLLERPERVLESVASDLYALPYYDLSASGSLVYLPEGIDRSADEMFWASDGDQQVIATTEQNMLMPAISPDGRQVAVTIMDQARQTTTWLVDVDRGQPMKLDVGGANSHSHVWTPDGRSLVFTADHEGPSNLYLKKVDSGDPPVRLTTSEQHHDAASFSPDGRFLTFAQMHPKTNWDLWVLDVTNGSSSPILATESEEIQPIISPDGNLLAYTSDETGQREVYLETFPRSGRKQRVSTAGGEDPVWSRDGATLYYRLRDGIYAAPIGSLVAGEPRLVFQGRFEGRAGYGKANWDVDPDGRFLLTSRMPTTVAQQINVILGWMEDR